MAEWVTGFLTPLIKFIFIGGFVLVAGFFVIKAVHNGYTKSFKFIIRYSILKRKYPIEIVEWCMSCFDENISWHEAKKILMVKGIQKKQLNETLWIYDKMIIELKGGIDNNGRNIKGVSGKTEQAETRKLPNIRER